MSSRQVSWYEAFRFAERLAAVHGAVLDHRLIAGTPRWCDMSDDDVRKLLALVLGGVREALAHDTSQTAMATSSRDFSTAGDWSAVARRLQQGFGGAHIKRKGAA